MERRAILCGVIGLALCAGFPDAAWVDEAEDAGVDHISVYRNTGPGGLAGFPDVCRLRDGRLMVVFYMGYDHVSPPNELLPRGGGIHCCFSADEGRTWSEPGLVFNGPSDDRDPGIVQLESGRLLSTFFHSVEVNWRGTWITHSDDVGDTWSEPAKVTPEEYFASSPIRVLSTGRLVLPLYTLEGGIAHGAVMVSDDAGGSWDSVVDIDSAGQYLDAETDVIELRDGRLYAIQRGRDTDMHGSISNDRGRTWSRSEPTGFRGISPYLLRAHNGIVVMVYGQIGHEEPLGTVIRFSLDDCATWSEAVLVARPAGSHPTMVNLEDGSVLAVYYDQGRGRDIRARRFNVTESGIEWLR